MILYLKKTQGTNQILDETVEENLVGSQTYVFRTQKNYDNMTSFFLLGDGRNIPNLFLFF
ncbi:hypothetical protein HZS_5880 [Henneguya salminicola]|nr:hypothetical protein HZS_5880 [Henneguya salminicola]